MTQEERKKYFKFYRGGEYCPDEWCGEPRGVIWEAERQIELNWDDLVSQEPERPIEERLEEWVSIVAGKFDPWDCAADMEFYRTTKGVGD